MSSYPLIRGSGSGKGGSPRTSTESPDTLRSKSFVKVVDLLGEGEIEGFVDKNNRLLTDCVINTVTIISGLFVSVTVFPGSRGYPPGPTNLIIVDQTGTGALVQAYADDQVTGEINRVVVAQQGSGYSDNPIVTIPPVLGKAIILDDAPLQNDDLTFNYSDVTFVQRLGTQIQDVIPGFDSTQRVIYAGNEEFKVGLPKSILITDSQIDELLIGIEVPQLYKQVVSSGDIIGQSVIYTVYITYQPPSLGAQPRIFLYRDTISGKTTTGYIRTRNVDIRFTKRQDITDHQWLLTVERFTPDSLSLTLVNKTKLNFVTGITYAPLTHPNSALVAIEVNAEQFKSIPVRGYRCKLLRVQIPTNYFPLTRTYNRDSLSGDPVLDGSGKPLDQIWDGTFYTAWTDNPAWCFYDLATSTRYGLGEYLPVGSVDKWSLYKIGKYCDELVPDGFGGQEPRFTCNVYFQTKEEAYKVLNDLASVFRGLLYWANGTVMPVQDAPTEPVSQFTVANVKDGMFTYAGTARKTRHSVALVRWNDPSDNYKPAIEYVEDLEGILKFGVREIEVAAFGCTSRGQAHRFGRWLLYSEKLETETIAFTTGMEGITLRPGDVIFVTDNNRSGVIFGGRSLRIADDRLQLTTDRKKLDFDAKFTAYANRVAPGLAIQFQAILFLPQVQLKSSEITDSTQIEQLRTSQLVTFQVLALAANPEGNLVLNFSTPLPADVEVGTIWGLTSTILVPQEFRIVSITEEQKYEFSITALEFHPQKYGVVEQGLEFEEIPISDLPDQYLYPQKPEHLTASFDSDLARLTGVFRITLSWDSPRIAYVNHYEVWMKKGLGNYQQEVVTPSPLAEIEVALSDTYFFQVFAIGVSDRRSEPATTDIFVGIDINPDDGTSPNLPEKITGLELFNQGNQTIFKGRDARFDWRINSPTNSYDIGSEPVTGANSGGNSFDFDHYIVRIYSPRFRDLRSVTVNSTTDIITSVAHGIETGTPVNVRGDTQPGGSLPGKLYFVFTIDADTLKLYDTKAHSLVGGATGLINFTSNGVNVVLSLGEELLLRNIITRDSGYLFGYDENAACVKGPHRDIIFEVTAKDQGNIFSKAVAIRVNNPHPTVPGGVVVTTTTVKKVIFQFPSSGNTDFSGWRVWLSTTNGFNPRTVRPVYEGISNPITLDVLTGTTYYYRFAEYDVFSRWEEYINFTNAELDVAISSQVSFVGA